jgi:F-type H+-transporting ATPase subunit epsilon
VIHFALVTLDGTKFARDVHEVLLPTLDGEIGVYTDHMPLVSVAVPGIIRVRPKDTTTDDQMEIFATNGGVIEIMDNTVRVLVDEADHADEISEKEAREAYERAQKHKAEAKDKVSLDAAQSLMDRHAVRLKVAELKRHRKQRY